MFYTFYLTGKKKIEFNMRITDSFQIHYVRCCANISCLHNKLRVSKWGMDWFKNDWLLYLPPCDIRVSLQKLDKISCLETERGLPRRHRCAMVVLHCHHLRTCNNSQCPVHYRFQLLTNKKVHWHWENKSCRRIVKETIRFCKCISTVLLHTLLMHLYCEKVTFL